MPSLGMACAYSIRLDPSKRPSRALLSKDRGWHQWSALRASEGPALIDWLTAHIPIRSAAALRTGEVSSVDADGVVEWVSAKRKSVQGSHSGSITVKRFRDGVVEFAGSPAKFLQGHNVFGSDDLQGLG